VQDSVRIAAFEAKLDTIAVMRTSRQDENDLLDSSNPKALSVVAFACVLELDSAGLSANLAHC
jgi:hypothetical protein